MKKDCDYSSKAKIYFEHSISDGDFSYLVIFGEHVNGGFISVVNWGWCCEASIYPRSSGYNAEKLVAAGACKKVAKEIAEYIELFLEKKKSEGQNYV